MNSAQQDKVKIERILEEIYGRLTRGSDGQTKSHAKPFTMDDSARALLMEYMHEVAASVIEESALLATHRKSAEIDVADVNLVLAKKFNIETAGSPRIKTFHKYVFKTQWPPVSKKRAAEASKTGSGAALQRTGAAGGTSSGSVAMVEALQAARATAYESSSTSRKKARSPDTDTSSGDSSS